MSRLEHTYSLLVLELCERKYVTSKLRERERRVGDPLVGKSSVCGNYVRTYRLHSNLLANRSIPKLRIEVPAGRSSTLFDKPALAN